MRQFIFRCLQFLLVLGIVLTLCGVVVLDRASKQNYLREQRAKNELVKSASTSESPNVQPRLIYVGGSSAAFGLNSHQLQEATGMSVINYGLMVEVGLDYQLKFLSHWARPQDVIVLAPEVDTFYGNFYGDSSLGCVLFYTGFEGITDLPLKSYPKLLTAIGRMFHDNLHPAARKNRYMHMRFNALGDEVSHWEVTAPLPTASQVKPITEPFEPENMDIIHTFVTSCVQRGIKVLITMAPLSQSGSKVLYPQLQEVFSSYRSHHFQTVGNLTSHIYPDSLMYDTEHHLNGLGVPLFTSQLAQELSTHLR